MLAQRAFMALIAVASLALPACDVGVDNKDRDKILASLSDNTNKLTESIDSLEDTFAIERAKLSQELQQTVALAVANLRSVTGQLQRSVETINVGITNFQQALTADLVHSLSTMTGTVDRLRNGLANDAAETIRLVAGELERERVAMLRQAHQVAQATIRPTMERLSREGDYFVGKVAQEANVLLVRVVTGIIAMIALVGMVVTLVRVKGAGRRWQVAGISLVVFLIASLSATVLAAPIARIGAPTYRIPSGSKVCRDMSEVGQRLRDAEPAGTPGPGGAEPEIVSLARQLQELSIECTVVAPTAELAALARDYYNKASRILGEPVACTTHPDCGSPDMRCDASTGECLPLRVYCDAQNDCAERQQCLHHARRCVSITDPRARCSTPADCRSEQSCDRATAKCVVTSEIAPTPCEIPNASGECRKGITKSVDRWVVCDKAAAALGTVETCDGLDNNCNGQLDEGIDRTDACPNAVGECSEQGLWECRGEAGWWCTPAEPATEQCDGLDNDCDGRIDDDVPPGEKCSAGLGLCSENARYRCVNEVMSCVPGESSTEVCDGKDNDCDGETDGADTDLASRQEVCNGLDDNCNGVADDGIYCHPAKVVIRDVDDETYLWVGESTDTRNAACVVKRAHGGAGECDLVKIMQDRGIGSGKQLFTIMTVNSGCWGTSSHADVVTDVETKAVHHQGGVTAHCGWVERDQFEVDFTTGQVFNGTNWGCVNDGNCRP